MKTRVSDRDGRLAVPAFDANGCRTTVTIVAGERTSEPFELRAGEQETTVVVK